ncbi:MAG TPA: hypothetical protein VEW48_17015 [Thermoanaerobaculia bacterium]|nr:hypothetical protein [Thermoanaerobaculia bacterium]
MSTLRPLLLLALLSLTSVPSRAALSHPEHEDIDYIAEHLPESGMDARFLALPWPAGRLEGGGWKTTLEAGYSDTATGFLTLDGPLFAASAAYSFRDGWAVEGMGFYDRLSVSGGHGREVLNPTFVHPPLDLPENADFSHPRGDYSYAGAGAGLVWQRPGSREDRWWTFMAGALWSRLELDGFQVDYQVATGASAGARGVLDHSSTNDYATPFAGIEWTRPLGERFEISPRAMAVAPLPKGDFTGRVTGPGFDLTGRGLHIGDPFVTFGMEVLHRPTGLAVDLGSAVYFAGAEAIVHKGVSRALTLEVGWHR